MGCLLLQHYKQDGLPQSTFGTGLRVRHIVYAHVVHMPR